MAFLNCVFFCLVYCLANRLKIVCNKVVLYAPEIAFIQEAHFTSLSHRQQVIDNMGKKEDKPKIVDSGEFRLEVRTRKARSTKTLYI